MKIKSNYFFSIVGIGIIFAVVVYPVLLASFIIPSMLEATASSSSSFEIVVRTLIWSLSVAFVATLIGWPVGVRIASLMKNTQRAIQAMLVMTLIIPAYAIFYVWWQAWPSGTWLHACIVEFGYLGIASKK